MPRSKTSDCDKDRLIESHENGEDFLSTAAILGIKRTTAYSIIRSYIKNGTSSSRTGGGRRKKLDNDSLDWLIMMIEANPSISIKKLNEEYRATFPNLDHIHDTTLSKSLDGELISLKKIHDVARERNTPRIKEIRMNYSNWIYNEGTGQHLIYIDECGFNLYTKRTYGHAPVGQRAVRIVGGQRGRNISAIVAISNQVGVIYNEIHTGSVTKNVYLDFITSLSAILGEEKAVLIMDNAPCHNINFIHEDHKIKYLPPYSPFLNPIENCFSVLKADLKQRLNVIQETVCSQREANRAGMSMIAWREHILSREIMQSMEKITQTIVENNYRKSNSYLEQCMTQADIFD